jgi:hypothetical protein
MEVGEGGEGRLHGWEREEMGWERWEGVGEEADANQNASLLEMLSW